MGDRVLCEYVSPMFGFRLPVLGRSDSSSEWTIEGHHLAERCQLFVIVALGETILITGATLSEMESWSLPVLIASLVAFLGSLAMWWVYFDTSSKAGSHAISQAETPASWALISTTCTSRWWGPSSSAPWPTNW
ncbi:hypothetical protein AK51_26590 [Serratia nematodiphila DZ0503SBS1]|nr:hypothetical protein AK51_26590 [Serratia nematodiphila DZ0503SBS1]